MFAPISAAVAEYSRAPEVAATSAEPLTLLLTPETQIFPEKLSWLKAYEALPSTPKRSRTFYSS
jgi:hypothetical protein